VRFSDLSYYLRHIAGSDDLKPSLLLFIAAAIALVLSYVTNSGEMVSSVLLLGGFSSFMIGMIVLIFHRGDLILPDVAGMLASGGQIAFGKMITGLGDNEGARIIFGESPIQFIPINSDAIPATPLHASFMDWNGTRGFAFTPFSLPLWHLLCTKYNLIRAKSSDAALASYAESVMYALELADQVDGRIEDDLCIIEIQRYKLYEGCALVRNVCPDCCTVTPCGVCGLAGIILADGTTTVWSFDQIQLIPETRSIRIELREIPHVD